MYERFAELLKEKGLRASDVGRNCGISSSSLSDWKSGRAKPKTDKLAKIADYLGVSVEYLAGTSDDPTPAIKKGYYIDSESLEIAQAIFDNRSLRGLFDVARKMPASEIEAVSDLLKKLKATNPDG